MTPARRRIGRPARRSSGSRTTPSQLIIRSHQSRTDTSPNTTCSGSSSTSSTRENLTCDGSPPMVGVNEHAADPHFEVSATDSTPIKENDRVLIDLWARENSPQGHLLRHHLVRLHGQEARRRVPDGYSTSWCRQKPHQAVHRRADRRRPAGSRLGSRRRLPQATSPSVGTATSSFIARAIRSTRTYMATGPNLDNLETKDEQADCLGKLLLDRAGDLQRWHRRADRRSTC